MDGSRMKLKFALLTALWGLALTTLAGQVAADCAVPQERAGLVIDSVSRNGELVTDLSDYTRDTFAIRGGDGYVDLESGGQTEYFESVETP